MRLILSLLLVAFSSTALAEVTVAKRHLLFLREGVDFVFGNYIFAVENKSQGEESFRAVVMLPKETADFQATEGLEPKDVKLDGDNVVVEKVFPPGVHVVGIAFKASSSLGSARLTFKPQSEIESLTVLTPKRGTIKVSSPVIAAGGADASPDEEYNAFVNARPLAAGDSFEIIAEGLPEGRSRIWLIGGAIGGAMLAIAIILALRTRPKIRDEGGEAFAFN